MAEKKKRKNKPGAGAPAKPEDEKKSYRGITIGQLKQAKELANIRGVTVDAIIRQGFQWYLDALDAASKERVINSLLVQAEEEAIKD